MKLEYFLDEVELRELQDKIYEYYKMYDKLGIELNELVNECYNSYSVSSSGWFSKKVVSKHEFKRDMFKFNFYDSNFEIEQHFYDLHKIDIELKCSIQHRGYWKPALEFFYTPFDENYDPHMYKELNNMYDWQLAHDIYSVSHMKVRDPKFMNFCAQILKYTTIPVVFNIEEITYYLMFIEHFKFIKSIMERRFSV